MIKVGALGCMAQGMMKRGNPLGMLLVAIIFVAVADIIQLGSITVAQRGDIPSPPSRIIVPTSPPLRINRDSSQLDTQWLKDTWYTVSTGQEVGWKLPNILARRSVVSKDDDVTLTVHTSPSASELRRLLFSIHRWGGPVSVSIRVTRSSEIRAFHQFVTQNLDQLHQTAIHLLMESPDNKYPHNILRQMAMDETETDYFLAVDVDFMTIPECHDKLRALLKTDPALVQALHNKTMMVFPAFNHEFKLKDKQLQDNDVLPSTKEDALKMVQRKEITPFHVAWFYHGHGPSDFKKWYSGKFDGSWYPINYVSRFEPYVLGYKPGISHYWEGFRGFGFNKFSWIMELHYEGYQFGVLRDFFVIHLDHSHARIASKQKRGFEELDRFREYLVQKYGADRKDLSFLEERESSWYHLRQRYDFNID
jgi:hypothetical protein